MDHNQTDYLNALYTAIDALSAGIETLLKDHDFSAATTDYPAVALDFDDRWALQGDIQKRTFGIQILVLVKIDTTDDTPIPTARETCDEIVEAIENTIGDGIATFHHPDRIDVSFGYAEDGTTPLYFALMTIKTKYVR